MFADDVRIKQGSASYEGGHHLRTAANGLQQGSAYEGVGLKPLR
jgi:hypothetical protein